MTSLRVLRILAPPLLVACFAAPGAAPAATRSCAESDRFIQQVRATNLTCRTAVAVAFGHARRASCFGREGDFIFDRATPCTVVVSGRYFRCRPAKADGGIVVRCTRRDNVVRFFNSGG